MAAILQRQPLTIKQQVEELKNWHKQQQSKLNPDNVGNGHLSKDDETTLSHNLSSRKYLDEIPIKVSNNNFNVVVENNVAPTDSHPTIDVDRYEKKDSKPKFRYLKKGEGIARFNMGPPKRTKRIVPIKQGTSLKLTKDPKKTYQPVNKDPVNVQRNVKTNFDSEINKDIPTLKVPDLKLNFTWKSILSGENPEDLLEKAINSNQLELMDPNSSIDSSTVSLMEKLLAIGKNKLSKDREELKVFEEIEQHILDSSFCSTSSYVNKLMENAVISTPVKRTFHNQQPKPEAATLQNSDVLPCKTKADDAQGCIKERELSPQSNALSVAPAKGSDEKSNCEEKLGSNQNSSEPKTLHSLDTWTTSGNTRNLSVEGSVEGLEESLHVRFAEQVDYKSFVEQSQSMESASQKDESVRQEFDESQEWIEDSEDSSSCCSQCSKHEFSTEDITPLNHNLKINHPHSQIEKNVHTERLNVSDLEGHDDIQDSNASSNHFPDNIPPMLLEKLKELEEEISVFREENSNLKRLKDSLERERKLILEEKRRLNLEKKKFHKEIEEERKRLTDQLEEEKQKLAKEKTIFEKYSKTLTKNPSRDERKEIQALREQLTEMKEELNKKESRWGAAQARVRNQVKVLEEDNKKLKEEIENFRKQAKYWELFNSKKKGKPFNNAKLIHAISEHISNLVLDDENNQETSSSIPKISTVTESDLKSMYRVRVISENKESTSSKEKSNSELKQNYIEEGASCKEKDSGAVVRNASRKNNSLEESDSLVKMANISTSFQPTLGDVNLQNENRCQKPCMENNSNNFIKETVDENGNVEIVFPNGNIKKINKITGSEKYIYVNGDVEEITHNGTIKYYYSNSRIWQTTMPDGLEIVDFPDGKVEKRHVDGRVEVIYSNNNKKISYPDGSQEVLYTDGTKLVIKPDKTHILTLPNGQKEIHTQEWKRREYPDGTMKTLYPDGTTETVYSNGRVRLKDKHGNLVMDSGSS